MWQSVANVPSLAHSRGTSRREFIRKITTCDDVTWLAQRLLICWLKVRFLPGSPTSSKSIICDAELERRVTGNQQMRESVGRLLRRQPTATKSLMHWELREGIPCAWCGLDQFQVCVATMWQSFRNSLPGGPPPLNGSVSHAAQAVWVPEILALFRKSDHIGAGGSG